MEDNNVTLVIESEAVRREFIASLPEGWVLSKSKKHGRLYYFNTETGESRWEHPLIPDDENQDKGPIAEGFTDPDFIMPTRDKPISHSASDPILCENCQKMELTFFDPNCPGCQDILLEPSTTSPQIFGVMRQWVPQVQQNLELLVKEILRRGAHVNDRDGLTDMSMLHYCCKAGAVGVGNASTAAMVVSGLISKGADVSQKCRWTDMLPLHYAAFFDVSPVLRILLKESSSKDVDTRCKEFDSGTPLHIAASNLCLEATRCLLQHGADAYIRDKLNRTPLECLPDVASYEPESEPAIVVAKMKRLLSEAEPKHTQEHEKENSEPVSLASLEIAIGDRIFVGGTKSGVLRFCGTTEFAPGEWAGVELEQPVGKNDGSVGGVEYFQCAPKHGIFAPVSKISKNASGIPTSRPSSRPASATRRPPGEATKLGTQPNSRPSSRPNSRPNSRPSSRSSSPAPTPRVEEDVEIAKKFEIGDHVLVAGQKPGVVQYIGETQFASGWWLGVELAHPVGKNDGSVGGVRYFTCKPRFGVFAPVSKVVKNPEGHDISENSFAVPSAPAPKSLHDSHGSSLLETSSRGSHSDVSMADSNPDLNSKSSSKKSTNSSNPDLSQRRGSSDRNGSRRGSLNTSLKPKSSNAEFKLTEGMSILVNSELGVVRYIGTAEFADGVWLGVEMRKPVGKNDGTVNGKRYFTCKPNYGLMVRPSRASCRGINCSKLVEDISS